MHSLATAAITDIIANGHQHFSPLKVKWLSPQSHSKRIQAMDPTVDCGNFFICVQQNQERVRLIAQMTYNAKGSACEPHETRIASVDRKSSERNAPPEVVSQDLVEAMKSELKEKLAPEARRFICEQLDIDQFVDRCNYEDHNEICWDECPQSFRTALNQSASSTVPAS